MWGVVTWFLDHVIRRQTDVRVRVHRAVLLRTPHSPSGMTVTGQVGVDAYFINVLNASPVRAVGITHVWLATEPETHILTRAPPARLEPDSEWETWVEVDDLPAGTTGVERLARVRLTNGSVVESVPRDDVPAAGYVPG